eukprot:5720098-Prymnesium_polylepis.1
MVSSSSTTRKSALWIKPDLFKMWIKTALGYASPRRASPSFRHPLHHSLLLVRQARIHPMPHWHAHGSTQYTNLASDPAGYDMQHARGGVKNHALHVGASDHIPVRLQWRYAKRYCHDRSPADQENRWHRRLRAVPPQLERLSRLASWVRQTKRHHRRPRPVPLAASRPRCCDLKLAVAI